MSLKKVKNFRYASDKCTGCCDHPHFPLYTIEVFFISLFSSFPACMDVRFIYMRMYIDQQLITNLEIPEQNLTHLDRCCSVYADLHLPTVQEAASIHTLNYIRLLNSQFSVETLILLTFPAKKRPKKRTPIELTC